MIASFKAIIQSGEQANPTFIVSFAFFCASVLNSSFFAFISLLELKIFQNYQIKDKKLIRKISHCLELFDVISKFQKEIDNLTREISIQLTSSQEKEKEIDEVIENLVKKIKFVEFFFIIFGNYSENHNRFSPPIILFSAFPFKKQFATEDSESVELDMLNCANIEIERCLVYFSSAFAKISQKIELMSATTNNNKENSQRQNNSIVLSQRASNSIFPKDLNEKQPKSKKNSEIETKPFFKTSNGLKTFYFLILINSYTKNFKKRRKNCISLSFILKMERTTRQ